MYIAPLLLLVPEFAADCAEEQGWLFDTIGLRKHEELDDLVVDLCGCNHIIDENLVEVFGEGFGSGIDDGPLAFQGICAGFGFCIGRYDHVFTQENGRGDSQCFGLLIGCANI